MDVGDGNGDARTFRVNFSNAGVSKLREEVKEKLKEFMGDYTDDTLVEYVIVLLKNGRRKDEARNELNVFLDDDSHLFVSWLWDHLGSNLNVYVQAQESQAESQADDASKLRPTIGEDTGRNDSHQVEAESENAKLSKSLRPRHNREWKGLVKDEAEHPSSHRYEFDNTHVENESRGKVGNEIKSVSTEPVVHRKRRHSEEQQNKEVVSPARISASRRLLQFAVRDAVATSKQSTSTAEPPQKRLRSVVSMSMENSNTEGHPHRIHSVARVPNAMATAIKAVAEAAKDVKRVRSSGNVFDRLGRARHVSDNLNQLPEFGDDDAAIAEVGTYGDTRGQVRATYDQRNDYDRPYPGNSSLLISDTRMADPVLDDVDHDRRVFRQRVVDTCQTEISGGHKGENSLAAHGRIAESAEDLALKSVKNQGPSGPITNTSHKINTPGNANTWKSSQYQEARENLEIDSRKFTQVSEVAPKAGVLLMKKNNDHLVSTNGSAKLEAGLQKESQNNDSYLPGPNPITRPVDDADARTIYVNNVHFAATKDSVSRHFNKFGEVLKVVILIDAATGQPKGSAYVEFTRKEAADSALSLDGTSFMSRILKVVRKSSVQPEASSMVTWPRVARASPFAISRFSRVPFSRGIPGGYRARLPIKPGARSMQWKRDAQSEVPSPGPGNSTPSSTPRSLTYVRTETKTN